MQTMAKKPPLQSHEKVPVHVLSTGAGKRMKAALKKRDCALLFGDARRKHHHHREPSHLIPPEPWFITGGAAHVTVNHLTSSHRSHGSSPEEQPMLSQTRYLQSHLLRCGYVPDLRDGEHEPRGRERRSRRSRSPPPTVVDLYRRDPLVTVVDPCCRRAIDATSLTSCIGW
ncbi:hypothetical protein F2Q70_00015174 [Brassica cretica]|uniref:Uncharacterized protein n=1 Tax=Brassica cretica TaxID=69181 RepID=A0A8S9KSL8_BRACR|nr:hypothetical protein F2Q70_00015174 [Brassica cretica]KAF2596761.1 hypothetical protein F2Q68_00008260 [Brassica cretica]